MGAKTKVTPIPHVRDVLDRALKGHFHRRLRELGYRRSAHTWRLLEPQRVAVINVQSSWTSSATHGTFTINLGSYNYAAQKRLYELFPDTTRPKGKLPVEWNCLIGTRIGQLMKLPGKQVDHWWEVTAKSDVDRLDFELLSILDRYALPWMEQVKDLKAAIKLSSWGTNPRLKKVLDSLKNGERS